MYHIFTPPAPSRGTKRISKRASRGAARAHLVANDVVVSVESGLEYKAALVLLARPDVVDLWEQPHKIRYVDEAGSVRHYTFDFLVTRRDGRRCAVEVKASRYEERARAKLALVVPYARSFGFSYSFHLLTEAHLGRDAVHDARLICDMRQIDGPDADAEVSRIVNRLEGSTTVAQIVDISGLGRDAFAAVIRAVGNGSLSRADGRRLSYDSLVRRAEPAEASQ